MLPAGWEMLSGILPDGIYIFGMILQDEDGRCGCYFGNPKTGLTTQAAERDRWQEPENYIEFYQNKIHVTPSERLHLWFERYRCRPEVEAEMVRFFATSLMEKAALERPLDMPGVWLTADQFLHNPPSAAKART